MKRRHKPDLMIVLVTLIGLGVLTTGLVQGAMRDSGSVFAVSAQK